MRVFLSDSGIQDRVPNEARICDVFEVLRDSGTVWAQRALGVRFGWQKECLGDALGSGVGACWILFGAIGEVLDAPAYTFKADV